MIVGEVGYMPFGQEATNLFSQLVASATDKSRSWSPAICRFRRRGETFSDNVLAAAMIDRLVHHAEVLTVSGDSYRVRARGGLLAEDRSND